MNTTTPSEALHLDLTDRGENGRLVASNITDSGSAKWDSLPDRLYFYSKSPYGRELSNFFCADFLIELKLGSKPPETFRFASAETAYQCLKQKRLSRGKVATFQIMEPAVARSYARTLDIRDDWDEIRDDAMRHVLQTKFTNPEMRAYLLGTGERELIHYAPWDEYWGTGRLGKGQNKLGVFLMQLRDTLRA